MKKKIPTNYLVILAPGRKFYTGNVNSLIVPGIEGFEGILPGHLPVVISIKEGEINFKENDQWKLAVNSGGFVEVEQTRVTIMCDAIEWPEEIDINRAREAKERAEERLNQKISQEEYIRSKAALSRALARIRVIKKIQ